MKKDPKELPVILGNALVNTSQYRTHLHEIALLDLGKEGDTVRDCAIEVWYVLKRGVHVGSKGVVSETNLPSLARAEAGTCLIYLNKCMFSY